MDAACSTCLFTFTLLLLNAISIYVYAVECY
jgi:predicted RNA methylase